MRLFTVTKPGIIFGNIITLSGGFFLASQAGFNFLTLLISIIGMSLVVACGCVLNNIIDQDIDQIMKRTKNRVLAKKEMSRLAAFVYALFLGLAGLATFYFGTNPLTTAIAFIGLCVYVGFYSLWFKRKSVFGTAIGGVAGAVPPVVGYCAVTNRFDIGALILFLILFIWQLPHSYSIAIFRLEDYSAAGIPVLPVTKGVERAKEHMCFYTVIFTIAAIMPTVFGFTGLAYLIVALIAGGVWIHRSIKGFSTDNNVSWARKMFAISILDITILSFMMAWH